MRLRAIACNVFMREVCFCISRSPHVVDVEFFELGEHVHSETLRNSIQDRIDKAALAPTPYDAIVLCYGICGNACVGLQARTTKVVIPRAHDCCTILLGSRERFKEHFSDNPSLPFSSAGYMERGEYYLRVEDGESSIHYGDAYASYVEQYGEENARYIWDTMHPSHPELSDKAVFIDIPETSHLGYAEAFRGKASAEGKECVCLEGSLRLLGNLLAGHWDPENYLILQPGQKTAGVYDWSEILRAVDPQPPGKEKPE